MAYLPGLDHMCSRERVISLDVSYAQNFAGLHDEKDALTALHQYRFERLDVPEALRMESGEWLKATGSMRLGNLEWPTDGRLPQ